LAQPATLERKRGPRIRPKRTKVVSLYTRPAGDTATICLDELGPVSPRTGLVAGRTPHQGAPGVWPRSRESFGLRRVAGARRQGSHAHRPRAQH
jgi:hypothetical protein